MASGPDRRAFLRGAAGAAGVGVLGAVSPKLMFARAPSRRDQPDVIIDVAFQAIGSGTNARNRVLIGDAVANLGDEVEWRAPTGAEIVLVAFKGRSPWRRGNRDEEVLPGNGTNSLNRTVPTGAQTRGKYSYTIVVQDSSNNTYAKDPDLDII